MALSIDQFYRALVPRLQEDLANRMASLASGGAARTSTDAATTGEKYAAQVSYIDALNAVLRVCDEIETEMYGGKKPAEGQE